MSIWFEVLIVSTVLVLGRVIFRVWEGIGQPAHCWHAIGSVTRTIDHGNTVPTRTVIESMERCCKCTAERPERRDYDDSTSFF